MNRRLSYGPGRKKNVDFLERAQIKISFYHSKLLNLVPNTSLPTNTPVTYITVTEENVHAALRRADRAEEVLCYFTLILQAVTTAVHESSQSIHDSRELISWMNEFS